MLVISVCLKGNTQLEVRSVEFSFSIRLSIFDSAFQDHGNEFNCQCYGEPNWRSSVHLQSSEYDENKVADKLPAGVSRQHATMSTEWTMKQLTRLTMEI